MKKTTKYQTGIIGVINLARLINPEIGTYKEHFINDLLGFSVRLSNGALNMSIEIAQVFEANPNSTDSPRIENVAKSFRKL